MITEQQTAGFGKVLIFGVGLIGGSLALALKKAGAVREIVGVGRSSLSEALALGLIDRAAADLPSELVDTDYIVLATPVAQMDQIFRQIAPHLHDKILITDGGSVKNDVITAARRVLGARCRQFVPAHPIAGAENSGPQAARADLYQQKKVVITPLAENAAEGVDAVAALWARCGAVVYMLAPEQHDRIFAAVSHMPHLLSYALVHDLAIRPDVATYLDFAASGFRDFTRIAASHPEMWRDICLSNRLPLIEEISRYQAILDEIKTVLHRADGDRLTEIFALARRTRRDWGEKQC